MPDRACRLGAASLVLVLSAIASSCSSGDTSDDGASPSESSVSTRQPSSSATEPETASSPTAAAVPTSAPTPPGPLQRVLPCVPVSEIAEATALNFTIDNSAADSCWYNVGQPVEVQISVFDSATGSLYLPDGVTTLAELRAVKAQTAGDVVSDVQGIGAGAFQSRSDLECTLYGPLPNSIFSVSAGLGGEGVLPGADMCSLAMSALSAIAKA